MKLNIEITEKNCSEVASLLNNILADEFVLYTKTRHAHFDGMDAAGIFIVN
jgi:starvation-inducible DNA-binding protein